MILFFGNSMLPVAPKRSGRQTSTTVEDPPPAQGTPRGETAIRRDRTRRQTSRSRALPRQRAGRVGAKATGRAMVMVAQGVGTRGGLIEKPLVTTGTSPSLQGWGS